MSRIGEYEETSINTRERTELVKKYVSIPITIEQNQTRIDQNTVYNSTLPTNSIPIRRINNQNKTYKSEITIHPKAPTLMNENKSRRCAKCHELINLNNEMEISFNNRSYQSKSNELEINDNDEIICSLCEYSQVNICSCCHEKILAEAMITFNDKLFHEHCLKCFQCKKSLINEKNIRFHENDIVCFQCYSEHFAPKCKECFQSIIHGKSIHFKENDYHFDCFRCGQCNDIINDTHVLIYLSKPCCQQCYEKFVIPICAQCSKQILDEKYPHFNGNKYHSNCFRCNHCDQILQKTFSITNGKSYCNQCTELHFLPKCFKCLKSIVEGKSILFNENNYHHQCFRCIRCDELINQSEFHTENYQPCCDRCFNQYSAPKCFKCFKSIVDGKTILFNENKYHSQCFRCIRCNEIINQSKFHTEKSEPCCEKCFNEYIAPKCSKCLQIISNGKVLRFDDKCFHENCFTCEQCQELLPNSKFYTKNSKPYCNRCYEEYFTPKCFKCGKSIVEKYTTFQGNKYHIQCFTCHQCRRSISANDKFISDNGNILCSTCSI